MPNDSGNNTTNNIENKFPDKGNFSATQNNVGNGFGQLNNMNNQKKEIDKTNIQSKKNNIRPISKSVSKDSNSQHNDNSLDNKQNVVTRRIRRPFNKKTLETREHSSDTEVNNDTNVDSGQLVPNEVKKVIAPVAGIGGCGCMGVLLMILIVAAVILSPIFLVQELIQNIAGGLKGIWNSIVYFFKGCDNETECMEKEKDSFYDTLLEVHDEYGKEYKVTLNTELITATLTYYDPMDVMEDTENIEDLNPSQTIDYKKSKKRIRDLAEHMVTEGTKCVDLYGNVIAEYSKEEEKECPEPILKDYYDENGNIIPNTVSKEEGYYIDDEKYKNYLKDEFIREFYFKGKNPESLDEKISIIIDDIYSRVEIVKYLNGSDNTSDNISANNIQVTITNCAGTVELETVSLYEYIQGVLYADEYSANNSEEFLKVQAVLVKNYLYAVNGVTPDSIPSKLRIKNCQMSQIYCNVKEGCHNLDDGITQNTFDIKDTISLGPDSKNEYYRPPVPDITVLEKIKIAINSTLTDFIIKDGKFVVTQYKNSCGNSICDATTNILDQQVANEMINSGKTYTEVLNHFYGGEINEISINTIVYPLDLVHNRVTSAYGWRVHPIQKYCRTHSGTDIGAPSNANIYTIADGVVVTNKYNGSYGNYTVIGHQPDGNGNYAYYSLYAHQIKLSTHISVGQEVKAGQVIGNVGSTGNSTGPHLHIEIYTLQNGKKVKEDPIEYFKGVELTGQVGGALYSSESACKSCLNSKGASNC